MTLEAGVHQDRYTFTGMAILASFSIGLVQDIADQRRTIAAMRIVTGPALAQFGREIRVLRGQRSRRVTTQAKRLRFLDQKIGIRRLMRLMAGVAPPLGVRCMGILELPGHPGVAFKADIRGTLGEQPGMIRGMWFMTAQALSLFNREVDQALALFVIRFSVAGEA